MFKVSMFSNFFFNLKTGCSLEIISPERVSVRFPDQVGKKWEERKGEGNSVNYIAVLTMKIGERDRDKSIMAGKRL